MSEHGREGIMWWVRVEEELPPQWGSDVEAVAAGINSRVSAHARRLGREPEVVRVRLGDRVPLADEELRHVFARLSRNGPLARAALIIERVPTRWSCPGCVRTQTLSTCCSCKLPVRLLAGTEMVLDSMQG